MGFLRRLAGIFRFLRHDGGADLDHECGHIPDDASIQTSRRPRKGFSVQVPVAVDGAALGPVLIPCAHGEGGVQGLKWFSRRLRVDEDGDVADEFLDEVPSSKSFMPIDNHIETEPSRFRVRHTTLRPVVQKQIVAINGNVHHRIEHQGKLIWV